MNNLIVRSLNSTSTESINNPIYKTIGIILALSSGIFIGTSYVFKKKGLLQAQRGAAGEGYAYLSNVVWWVGMILMIIGEICNFVAYAFTQAILVTPLGALSVVISAILSSIFLKERLNFQGKVGCAQCIIGAVIIVMHAPSQQTASTIDEFKQMFFSPIFLTYAIVCITVSLLVIWKVAPKYGSKNMLVYIGICSLIGSLSVVTTQGLGTAIVTTIGGQNQLTNWFFYVLTGFVIVTLLTEINYLNKALNLFNTAMVTPLYYVSFTSMTIISSAILSKGFEAPPVSIFTVVLGFLVICCGIILLQTSRGASVDGIGSLVLSDPTTSTLVSVGDDNDPGAMDIRGSFGSIRRLSSYGRAGPINKENIYTNESGNNHTSLQRRSQSLNHGHYRQSSSGMPTIHEKAVSLPAEITIQMSDSLDTKRLSRNSTVQFLPPTSSVDESTQDKKNPPIIRNITPSISSISSNPKSLSLQSASNNGHQLLSLPPPPSPLQHPINYIKQHLSPTNSMYFEPNVASESYDTSFSNSNRSSSASIQRSQQNIGLVDRIKLGTNVQDDNYEGLVGRDSNKSETGSAI